MLPKYELKNGQTNYFYSTICEHISTRIYPIYVVAYSCINPFKIDLIKKKKNKL